MAENKNALAELAERLTPDHVVNVNGRATAEEIDFDALIKAQRIIAVLAKVELPSHETDYGTCRMFSHDIQYLVDICRAIAAEGDDDGK